MIVSTQTHNYRDEFERVLSKMKDNLKVQANQDESYFFSRAGVKLEKDVFDVLLNVSKQTPFENTFELISGQRFPDIVSYVNDSNGFGLEVKTSNQNHWKTTGSSIFESTRVDKIEHIYLLFGKLVSPIDFKLRKYEECLYDVAVTHSPRYLIDMDIKSEETIFSKINVLYNELRLLKNPFKPVKEYYRNSKLSDGDDLWWIENENASSNIIRQWSNLSVEEKKKIQVEAFCLFPELFSNSTNKYKKLSSWLVAKYQIVSPSLRDTFTAGGRVNIIINGNTYNGLPRIYDHLNNSYDEIRNKLYECDFEELKYYWNYENEINVDNVLDVWIDLINHHSQINDLDIGDIFY